MNPRFLPGRNMAMKVPTHEYTSTVAFYRETLRLKELTPNDADGEQTPRFEFGDKVLWLDRVAGISQAEIWFGNRDRRSGRCFGLYATAALRPSRRNRTSA